MGLRPKAQTQRPLHLLHEQLVETGALICAGCRAPAGQIVAGDEPTWFEIVANDGRVEIGCAPSAAEDISAAVGPKLENVHKTNPDPAKLTRETAARPGRRNATPDRARKGRVFMQGADL